MSTLTVQSPIGNDWTPLLETVWQSVSSFVDELDQLGIEAEAAIVVHLAIEIHDPHQLPAPPAAPLALAIGNDTEAGAA